MQQSGQVLRHVLALGESEVIGCFSCGEVEHLIDGAQHHCYAPSDPTAITLSSNKLIGKPAVRRE